ncbi:UspA domain protein [Catenulispora acidiphila DSM 44928]|uniref:UspA domain protein n=1 Tax=Catenulispora acidiphila (strain DSM 44928 / JCM 14897 / NBRC 102108 / NRRL B-24433 / ID139908) TaxID=479433 RepID=C7Q6N9_CATAD|nr:universal stress protein [Catenulispora acidiphila]ACU74074.1 UspA domain protein [Catenulispora acidiphila DSM 44928]
MESGVVVGYDQSAPGERALAEAAAEAARRNVALTVVHVVHHVGPDLHRDASAARDRAHYVAEEGVGRALAGHPDLTVQARTVAGHPSAVLAEESSEAELLVVGHHGYGGMSSLRPGSVALRTVAHAPCPSMMVRGSEHQRRGTVVAAVDIDGGSEELLDFAYAEAAARGARLKAVSALDGFWPRMFAGDSGEAGRPSGQAAARAEEALEQLLEPWPERYPGVVTDHELIEGSPTTYLTGATTYADLIVVGVHRRPDNRHGARVGPVAETLLLHADCPVAIVPHD